MQRVELELKPRNLGEKDKQRNLSQLRSEGWIPGVVYGHGEPTQIAVELKSFNKAIHTKAGLNALFTIKFDGQSQLAIIKEVQRHIFRHNPIHVDFKRIDVKEKIEITVPVHAVGEAPGVKNDGGILEHITREVRVRCLPDDIPPSLDVDVTQLGLGQSVKVKDVPAMKGIEILTSGEAILLNIVAPKVEEVKAPAAIEGAAAAGAEPEVITKGKKEEEGAEGAAKPAAGAAKAAAPAAAKGKEEKKK